MGSTTSLFTKKTKPSKKEEEQEEDEEEEVQEDEEDEDTKLCNEMVAPHSLSSEERDKKFVSLFQTGAGDWYSLIQVILFFFTFSFSFRPKRYFLVWC